MAALAPALVPMGILLPDSILRNEVIAVLAAFVAINTVAYVALAVAKILPKFYLRDWLAARNRRAETRSIHPDAAVGGPVGGSLGERLAQPRRRTWT
ncbi:hypothetical protein [Nocardioides baculatus]|jgi:hypothetical protein|uniref:Uncharacterized protein n=1 Tax=Nocardioides baculatus TaxID=2801337 RepID=A0ABS1L3W4_9ACTN|nr:hypothetical protein [Nocardioides baculatus]MBL0746381.1 hypothetical protein [Nocardioides baculatus]